MHLHHQRWQEKKCYVESLSSQHVSWSTVIAKPVKFQALLFHRVTVNNNRSSRQPSLILRWRESRKTLAWKSPQKVTKNSSSIFFFWKFPPLWLMYKKKNIYCAMGTAIDRQPPREGPAWSIVEKGGGFNCGRKTDCHTLLCSTANELQSCKKARLFHDHPLGLRV